LGKEAVLSEQYRYFVGIDWATESHEVCVLNAAQQVIDRKAVEHSGSGIAQFVETLKSWRRVIPNRLRSESRSRAER
jgi:hypothetical protein